MKTSKKILALMLALSLVFSITAVNASAADTLATYNYVSDFNNLWDKWDENGEIELTAKLTLSEGNMSVTWDDDSIIPSTLYNSTIETSKKYYSISGELVIDGPTPYTIPFSNAVFHEANDASGYNATWFTSVLPFTGTVAEAMKADAAADETLMQLLHVEDGVGVICKDDKQNHPVINGEASAKTYTSLSKENLMIYVDYKAGNNGSRRSFTNMNATVTLKTPYMVETLFPTGSFFISEYDLETFVSDDWSTQGTHYNATNNTYVSTSAYGGMGLDLSYGVFEAPATGTYKVLALKRDRVHTDANQRVYAADVAGVEMIFGVTNCPYSMPESPAYYWEIDEDAPTVTLTKGQKFPIRTLQETSGYAGLNALVFVPATADVTSLVGLSMTDSKVGTKEDIRAISLRMKEGAVADAITVNFNGKDLVVNAGVSGDYYPNIRLYDKDGAYIEKQTALDAIVAAKEATTDEADYGVSNVIKQEMHENTAFNAMPGGMATPFTYDTYLAANGTAWTSTGNSYAGFIWPSSQTYFGNGTLTMPVTIHESGDYYVLTSGSAWETNRNITVSVGSTEMMNTESSKTFLSNTKSGMTRETSAVATHLEAGTYTMTVKCTNSMRFEYVFLVQAESQEAAVAIHESLTDKATVEEYFDYDYDVWVDGKMTSNKILTVNNVPYEGDLDQVTIKEGDVITYKEQDKTNFAPISTKGMITGNGGSASGDAITGVSNKFVTKAYQFPFDATGTDALDGTYLNGYITMDDFVTQEFELDGTMYYIHGTDGDESRVVMVVRDFPITKSAYNASKGRYELGYKPIAPFDGKVVEINGLRYKVGISSAQLQSDPISVVDASGKTHKYLDANNEEQTTKKSPNYNYDLTHLYLTNTQSAAPLKVTATALGNGTYQLTSNKTVLVKLITIVDNGGIQSVSSETKLIDFMDADGITVTVEDGETVYVWEGEYLVGADVPTNMMPLCAPLTK